MEFKELLNAQYELGHRVAVFITNCKKAGKPRRTLQFYDDKIDQLQIFGDEFHNSHGKILRHDERDANDEYFASNYYETIRSMITDYIKVLENEARQLEPQGNRTQPNQTGAEPPVNIDSGKTLPQFNQTGAASSVNVRKLLRNQRALIEAIQDNIKGIMENQVISSNYVAAWEILKERYDNKRLLVSSLLNTLFSQPAIKTDSASSIKALHDVTKECLHGLMAQGLTVQHWDALLVHMLYRKKDQTMQTACEQSLTDSKRLIMLEEILKFLEKRFQSMEVRSNGKETQKRTCGAAVNSDQKCLVCKKGNHPTYNCSTFKAAKINERWQFVKQLKLCVNCLRSGHQASACKSQHCTKCEKKHNTLLHNESTQSTATASSLAVPSTKEKDPEATKLAISLLVNNTEDLNVLTLLGTARINMQTISGDLIECRALLDSGSQINFVTERFVKKLGLSSKPSAMSIEGIGMKGSAVRHRTTITIHSRTSKFTTTLDCHIIPRIISDQPGQTFSTKGWNIPQNLQLADPNFSTSQRIDCLLGAEIFFNLLTNGKLSLGKDLPVLKNTVFGWAVSGKAPTINNITTFCGICTSEELDATISKFWEREEIPAITPAMSEDDMRCECHFVQNTLKAEDGRFVVKLPLKAHPSTLTESREIAFQRIKTIERRLCTDGALKRQYVLFMREYEQLGHMTKINSKEIVTPHYFIPHHCVLRPNSSTTKLRVVFDASASKFTAPSLNDIMFTGPKVQSELFSILLRFRTYRCAFTTDIEKMYRQIFVNKEDRNLQLIMWREQPNEPINIYQLNTLTYGTRAAPYLATRCLVQLAKDNKGTFPYGAQALKHDFYVDDGLSGADTMHEALQKQTQLINILSGAQMKLRKWCANDPRLLAGISVDDQEVELNFESTETQSTKTLGLTWLPKSDVLCINSNIQNHSTVTKRTMTSDLAHIYDPLGLAAPVVVTGKILIQQVWQTKLDWDAPLHSEISKKWQQYRSNLANLKQVTIPRHVFSKDGHTKVELHAFADASEKAYGAAIYIRTLQKDKSFRVNLLCARSRGTPIKATTIPRLELCAALLAAELMSRVKHDLRFEDITGQTHRLYYPGSTLIPARYQPMYRIGY